MEKGFLISRWFGADHQAIPIDDEASVSLARERVRETGRAAQLPNSAIESVALIASELTHNQLRHTRQGYFKVHVVHRDGVKGLEVVSADIGPGIAKPRDALRDKSPNHGSLSAGLSAVCRIADEVEFDNRVCEGTLVIARKFEGSVLPHTPQISIMSRPYPGEVISGDDAVVLAESSGFLAAVIDGLGHGPEARQASNRAVEMVTARQAQSLDQIAISVDIELAGTRGCAMSLVRFDRNAKTLESVSLGDVHAHVYNMKNAHFFTATPFMLGTGQLRKQAVRVERTPVELGSVLVMFTDGLKSRATLKGQLDVLRRIPIDIAEHLLETESRPDDDALVLVARLPRM